MNIAFCDRWWLSKKRPTKLIDAESAQSRHRSRQPYVALIGGAESPEYVIDLAGEWISVIFLDERLRPYLRYDFKELEPNRLFLKGATFREYRGEEDDEQCVKIFAFEKNGEIVIEDRDVAKERVREFATTANVEKNWDRYPEFGKYLSLCRKERVTLDIGDPDD